MRLAQLVGIVGGSVLYGLWFTTLASQHPCDLPEIASGQTIENTPLYATFCQAATQNIDAATIYRNGVAQYLSTLDAISGPNAQGRIQYRVSLGVAPPRGTYTYTATTWNKDADGVAQEGAPTAPFVLSVVAVPVPRPTAPSNLRLGSI